MTAMYMQWICLYIERWLKTPFVLRNGEEIERNAGTPQAPFEKYADDGVYVARRKKKHFL